MALFLIKFVTKLPEEEPFFKNCCICIPIKSCLLTWSFIKAVLDVALSVYLTLLLTKHRSFKHFPFVHTLFLSTVFLLANSGCMIILNFGLRKRNLRLVFLCYYYSLFMIIAATALLREFISGKIVLDKLQYGPSYNIVVICGLLNTCVDLCMIAALRSELTVLYYEKLKEANEPPTLI